MSQLRSRHPVGRLVRRVSRSRTDEMACGPGSSPPRPCAESWLAFRGGSGHPVLERALRGPMARAAPLAEAGCFSTAMPASGKENRSATPGPGGRVEWPGPIRARPLNPTRPTGWPPPSAPGESSVPPGSLPHCANRQPDRRRCGPRQIGGLGGHLLRGDPVPSRTSCPTDPPERRALVGRIRSFRPYPP
jgi:hypothetical protein